ncbi:hypothetical protein E2C01_037950 [Portunus trituberculatus]|uniref:Uncharacterized protein n=1 Tax=Portunus trituberculatus TaxID=210409 RepID=A0A5B7FGB2_PORTR|nr:hypothetical protein [Portunus trituberculatus]
MTSHMPQTRPVMSSHYTSHHSFTSVLDSIAYRGRTSAPSLKFYPLLHDRDVAGRRGTFPGSGPQVFARLSPRASPPPPAAASPSPPGKAPRHITQRLTIPHHII